MDLFFKIINLLRNIFNVKNNTNTIESHDLIMNYTVNIVVRVNPYDKDIITRRYNIEGLTQYKDDIAYYKGDAKRQVNKIAQDITKTIELHSDVKIPHNKLHDAIQVYYNGEIKVNDKVCIKFNHKVV